jgi:hypothetical protein
MKCFQCGKDATRMIEGQKRMGFPTDQTKEWIFVCEEHKGT